MPPLQSTRNIRYNIRSRAGYAPPLRGGVFLLLRNPVMVRYFRQVCRGRINASRGVCPLVRIAGMIATGGLSAAPTDDPLYLFNYTVAGGAYTAPIADGFLFSRRAG